MCSSFISIVSGDGSASNLTVDTNGTVVASNGLTNKFSSSGPTVGLTGSTTTYSGYDLTDHVMGTYSTPTSTGYSSTAFVSDNGSGTYGGGPVSITTPTGTTLTSENISPFSSGTTTADVGYYIYTVSFTVAGGGNSKFMITGLADADNEVQDVILDYGSTSSGTGASGNPYSVHQTGTVMNIAAVNSTEVQTTNNAASNASFSGGGTNFGGTHTLSFVVYNQSGPTDLNFAFTAQAVPEPGALCLLGGILPVLGAIALRRKNPSLVQ